ncbi:MAG: hypothetical protein A3D92_09380, partial [Bacteroidetes bacterium RIFCSPHIGHO2_02_FULL_44_7]
FLRYAFGEVIIVIIGILIAVEFGAWQADKEFRKTELIYLNGFVEDQMIDQAKMVELFALKEKQYRSANDVLEYFRNDHNSAQADSFLYDFFTVSAWYDFKPASNTYNQLIHSGHFDLIQNEVIKDQILELREAYDALDSYHAHVLNDYEQYLYGIFEIVDLKTLQIVEPGASISFAEDAEIQLQIKEVLENTAVKNGVHLFLYNHENIGRNLYLDILKKIKTILHEIRKEIKR